MSLRAHIKPEQLLQEAREHPHRKLTAYSRKHDDASVGGAYVGRYTTDPIPKFKIPSKGIEAKAAYQLVHDHLALDGEPLLNLASFVHTWMPDEAVKLMVENMSKNLIDEDEYPQMVQIHSRCVSMIADLWKAHHAKDALGTATTGSSEAIMLGGLAMKKIWQAKMKAAGKNIHEPGPNVVMGANAQVALEKFARYFDVECRLVPVDESTRFCMSPDRAMEYVDENTIGVFVIAGSTYTGHYEDVERMDKLLTEYEEKTGIHVPIHVDAASGGFVAPFAHPNFKMSFDLPRVVSINTSGHKFGLHLLALVGSSGDPRSSCLRSWSSSFTTSGRPSSPSRSTSRDLQHPSSPSTSRSSTWALKATAALRWQTCRTRDCSARHSTSPVTSRS